jgi:membrane-bound metal-dependent hydrolase YbcI (DUF457 family)
MLPPGHIAAGFLTAKVLLNFTHPALSQSRQEQLLWWGMFFGFAPDLDMFLAFFKQRSLLVAGDKEVSHRKFYSHAPILWLIAGLLIYFLSGELYVKYLGLLVFLGSWSHFLLDSIEHGIMWLWPFSTKVFALKNREVRLIIKEKNFFKHSWQFLKFYSQKLSFYLEIIVIISALIVFFH